MAKVIVVGGVAGGATAASQLRRLNKDVDITIYEKDRDISFANCGLPYHIGGDVDDRKKLIAATPESFQEKAVAVNTYHEVLSVDTSRQHVTVRDIETGRVFDDDYDHLILSPGGRARELDALKGADNAFVLHNLEDMDRIIQYIETNEAQSAAVVGAGYISMEVVENLKMKNMDVTLVHRNENLYGHVEQDIAVLFHEEINANNIDLRMNSEVASADGRTVHLTSNESLDADIIIQGIGLNPNTEFLKDSNIGLTDEGLIPVDQFGATNVDNVYALGDSIETFYLHMPKMPVNVPLAWGAHRLAYVIGNQIGGDPDVKFEGLLSTSIMRFFDHTVGSLGLSPDEVRDIPHICIDHSQKFKAGYMEGSGPITVKMYIAKDTGKILRAVVAGTTGVDKRLDTLAAHMRLGGTAPDLVNIEVAYSPPYSSPKSVLNMVGYKSIEAMKKAGTE